MGWETVSYVETKISNGLDSCLKSRDAGQRMSVLEVNYQLSIWHRRWSLLKLPIYASWAILKNKLILKLVANDYYVQAVQDKHIDTVTGTSITKGHTLQILSVFG